MQLLLLLLLLLLLMLLLLLLLLLLQPRRYFLRNIWNSHRHHSSRHDYFRTVFSCHFDLGDYVDTIVLWALILRWGLGKKNSSIRMPRAFG